MSRRKLLRNWLAFEEFLLSRGPEDTPEPPIPPEPSITCDYALNDDGTLAGIGNFGYAYAGPAIGTNSQSMDYTASVSGEAILAPAQLFGTARFSRPTIGSTVVEAEITVATGTAEPILLLVISNAAGSLVNVASVVGATATVGRLGVTVASDGTVKGWKNGLPTTLAWFAGPGTVGETDKFGFALMAGGDTQIGNRVAMTLHTSAANITGIWYGEDCTTICDETVVSTGVLYDSFTDTPGTAITSHTPDIVYSPASGSWAQDVGGTFAIDSTTGTTLVRTSAARNDTHVYFDCGISDGIVAVPTLPMNVGMEFRRSDQSNLWLLFHSTASGGRTWILYERVAGTYTSRGSYKESLGTSYKAAVVLNGAQIDCYINGTLRISYASAASGLSSTKVGFDLEIKNPPAPASTDIYVINSTDPADIPV